VGDAEAYFYRSLDSARRHQARAWELRAATSLALLRRDQGRSGEARELLTPIYERFHEGFASADLVAAKELLDEL
jgi:predicted ATPase